MKIKTIIVDDEESAIITMKTVLTEMFAQDVEILGAASSAGEAIKLIEQKNPDLLLLDIEMPQRDGFDVLDSFPEQPFKVVFVTAHEEYAIRALKSNAMDYLLKPVDLDDIRSMLEKFKSLRGTVEEEEDDDKNQIISLRNNRGWLYLRKGDIVYIENRRGVPHFVMLDGKIYPSSKRIGDYEEILGERFYRVHNSYLVNVMEILQYDTSEGGEAVLNNGERIPVARRRGPGLIQLMEKRIKK